MSIKRNGVYIHIITGTIKSMLGGVLITVIGFIGSLLGLAVLFVINLKSLLRKMGLEKAEQKYTIRKR
tara:strand:- start:2243 stop:2446 length:204 start_codon:yes stop_codon:yes gene_type:complete